MTEISLSGPASPLTRALPSGALLLGSVLYAVSTFFWQDNGIYGTTGASFLVCALVCWLYGLTAIYTVIGLRWRRFATAAQLMLVYGTIGGVCFAVRGFYDGAEALSREASIAVLNDHPVPAAVMFFIPGPLFPLSLVIIGVSLIVLKLVRAWTGALIALSGILFPLTTILRVTIGAQALSVLMIAGFAMLAVDYFSARHAPPSDRRRRPPLSTLDGPCRALPVGSDPGRAAAPLQRADRNAAPWLRPHRQHR